MIVLATARQRLVQIMALLPGISRSGATMAGRAPAGSVARGSGPFLTRWSGTRTLTPFAVYSVLAGATSLLWLPLT
jgi:hypothetical protein